jgi:hypothetical protein
MIFVFALSLYRAYHNALDEIPLEKGVNQQDRDRGFSRLYKKVRLVSPSAYVKSCRAGFTGSPPE